MQHTRKTQNRPEKPLAQTRQAASRVSDYGTRYGYYLFENAYGYAGVNKINIADAGLVCVLGQNLQTPEPSSSGAGKTRMWKLFLYLWFGKKALGSAESIKDAMVFGKNFRIECTVQRHGKWYLVREAHNHESFPEGLHAYEIVDKKLKPWGTVNDPNALRAKLQGLIGVSYNEMIGTTVWPQDFTHTLICGKPQERITFLSELYGFTKYDEVYKYLDTLHAQVKSKIEQLLEFKGEYRVIEQELSQVGDIKAVIDKARQVKAWIDDASPKLTNMRRKLGDANRRIDRYNEIAAQLEAFMKLELDARERNLLIEGKLLSTFDAASKSVEQKLATLEAQVVKADRLKELKSRLAALNVEPIDVDKLQREQQHLSASVIPQLARDARWSRDEIETLSSGAVAIKTQVAQLCRELKVKPEAGAINKAYSSVKQQLDEVTADMRAVSEQHSALSALINGVTDSRAGCKCPTCLQPVDLSGTQKIIDSLFTRGEELDSACVDLEDKHDALEKLVRLFAQYRDLTDHAQQATASIQSLDRLDKAQQRLSEINNKLSAARQHQRLLHDLSQLEAGLRGVDIAKLPRAVDHYASVVQANDEKRESYYQAEKVSAQVTASAESLGIENPFDVDVASELQELNTERERLETALELANNKVNDARVKYEQYKQIVDTYRTKRDHLKELQSKIDELRALEERELVIAKTKPAYSKTGFKREGLRKLLEKLAKRLPHWTRVLFTEKNFVVNVNGDERKLSLTVPKQIVVDGKTKTQNIDVSALSGGERSRLAICLMLTMSELVAREKRSNLLVLDEADRSLDPYGQKLMAHLFIPMMRKHKDGLFVISHSQVIEPQKFDKKLVITKEKTGVTRVAFKENTNR